MQKSFKYSCCLLAALACSPILFAQKSPVYKDVLLNGKPAKLNMATGEFILVNGKTIDTIKPLELNKDLTNTVNKVNSSNSVESNFDETAPNYHVVKAGETLFELSKKYGSTLKALKTANNLETTLVAVGQKLRVRNLDAVKNLPTTYTVSKGDTLYSIAKRHNTTVTVLKQLNDLKSNTIFIGQILSLK